MNVLVTGGTGYIGSHTVVELSKAGYNPVIMDNLNNSEKEIHAKIEKLAGKNISFYQTDCRNTQELEVILKKENINAVIHFAAHKSVNESIDDPTEYYDNNVGGLISLLKAMENSSVKNIVFSSSCTVYGIPEKLPVDEQEPFKKAHSPYGNSKQICEQILELTPKIKSVNLRYFNPIGAHPTGEIGELPNGVPSNLVPYITQTAAGIREQLTVFGTDYDTKDGSCVRDFIHVVDLAKAHVAAISFLKNKMGDKSNEAFNIGTGNGNSVIELVETFQNENNVKLNVKWGERRQGDIAEIYAEASKSNDVLEWKAELFLAEALRDAWNWEKKLRNIS